MEHGRLDFYQGPKEKIMPESAVSEPVDVGTEVRQSAPGPLTEEFD